MTAYPLLLDLSARTVLLVGGGAVAARKAAGLLEAGAGRVRCVSPAFHPEMPAGVERVVGTYDQSHLIGATLVFATTNDPAVNSAVVQDARAIGILAHRADSDDSEPGDFTTPAQHQDGAVTIRVSAGGSPALARRIKADLAAKLDRRHVRMADAMRTIRPMVLAEVPDPALRRTIFIALAGEEAIDLLTVAGEAALIEWVQSRYTT